MRNYGWIERLELRPMLRSRGIFWPGRRKMAVSINWFRVGARSSLHRPKWNKSLTSNNCFFIILYNVCILWRIRKYSLHHIPFGSTIYALTDLALTLQKRHKWPICRPDWLKTWSAVNCGKSIIKPQQEEVNLSKWKT